MESKLLDIMGILLDIKNIQIITLKRIEMLEKILTYTEN